MANSVWLTTQLLTPPKTGSVAVANICRRIIDEPFYRIRHHGGPKDFSRYSIGTIRNPLSTYVSLWAFGCEKHGKLWEADIVPKKLYGDANNIDMFVAWMDWIFKKYDHLCLTRLYRVCNDKIDKIEAWVLQENMRPTLEKALEKSPAKLVPDWREQIRERGKAQLNTTKHRPWEEYYDNTLRSKVIDREQKIFYKFYEQEM